MRTMVTCLVLFAGLFLFSMGLVRREPVRHRGKLHQSGDLEQIDKDTDTLINKSMKMRCNSDAHDKVVTTTDDEEKLNKKFSKQHYQNCGRKTVDCPWMITLQANPLLSAQLVTVLRCRSHLKLKMELEAG